MTYNSYFLDQNYESKFDTKNKVALFSKTKGVLSLEYLYDTLLYDDMDIFTNKLINKLLEMLLEQVK